MRHDTKQNVNRVLPFLLGILAVTAGYLPYLVLRENCVIPVSDQLDGEIVTYYLGAKHLFDGRSVFPEVMCGVSRNALIPPSFLTVLFYAVLPPFPAFLFNQYCVLLAAFTGMYLLQKELGIDVKIAFCVAVFFAYLPFYSVYGLSVAGLPLLVCAVIRLCRGGKKLPCYALIALYCFSSSLVLIGYAVLGALVLAAVFAIAKRKYRKELLTAFFLSLACYVLQNMSLLLQVFAGNGEPSHKEEIVLQGVRFLDGLKGILWEGNAYAPTCQKYLVIPIAAVLFFGGIFYKRCGIQSRNLLKLTGLLAGLILLIGLFYAAANCNAVVQIRNQIGGLVKYFQTDRIYWFYPLLWYLAFGCALQIIYAELPRVCAWCAGIAVLGCVGVAVLLGSNFKLNVHQMFKPETLKMVSWEQYFDEALYAEIMEYIEEETGMTQSEYRVASLGIQPAVAVMNGFYTIDMYSNNYSLAYKHAFRRIIERELNRSALNILYFDDWGNRCYLCSAEYGFASYFGKQYGIVYHSLELNTEAMAEMNCKYILSAGEIQTAEEMNLCLERIFEEEDSYYRVYLYRIE